MHVKPFSRRNRTFVLLAILLSISMIVARADNVVLVTNPANQQANDFLNWAQLGPNGMVLKPSSSATSIDGVRVTAGLTGPNSVVSVVCPEDSCSWTMAGFTGFAAGDSLVWTSDAGNGGTGPVTLKFGSRVFGAGAFIQADGPGQFTAQIQAFDGTTSLGSFTVASDESGNPVYIGVLDQTAAHITSVTLGLSSCVGLCTDFAIDTVYLDSFFSNVKTQSATLVTASGALLAGTVNPEGDTGSVLFDLSTDPNNLPAWGYAGYVIANLKSQPFNFTPTGLASGTTYYFRIEFDDSINGSIHFGPVLSFTTKNPVLTTAPATLVTASGALLAGTVNPKGDTGSVLFDLSTDPNNLPAWGYAGYVIANLKSQPFNFTPTGLASGTTYYFCIEFDDSINGSIHFGPVHSFITKP